MRNEKHAKKMVINKNKMTYMNAEIMIECFLMMFMSFSSAFNIFLNMEFSLW